MASRMTRKSVMNSRRPKRKMTHFIALQGCNFRGVGSTGEVMSLLCAVISQVTHR